MTPAPPAPLVPYSYEELERLARGREDRARQEREAYARVHIPPIQGFQMTPQRTHIVDGYPKIIGYHASGKAKIVHSAEEHDLARAEFPDPPPVEAAPVVHRPEDTPDPLRPFVDRVYPKIIGYADSGKAIIAQNAAHHEELDAAMAAAEPEAKADAAAPEAQLEPVLDAQPKPRKNTFAKPAKSDTAVQE